MKRRQRAMNFRNALIESDVKNKRRKAPAIKPKPEPVEATKEVTAEVKTAKKKAPAKRAAKKKGDA